MDQQVNRKHISKKNMEHSLEHSLDCKLGTKKCDNVDGSVIKQKQYEIEILIIKKN